MASGLHADTFRPIFPSGFLHSSMSRSSLIFLITYKRRVWISVKLLIASTLNFTFDPSIGRKGLGAKIKNLKCGHVNQFFVG